jgi:hypothetical protein
MGFLSRFFGKSDRPQVEQAPVALPLTNKNPLGLQILFAGEPPTDVDAVTAAIRAYDAMMAGARFEIHQTGDGGFMGSAEWGNDAVAIVGFGAPMPAPAVKACVAPAHYDLALKKRAVAHSSHALLYYSGKNTSPHQQYVALAAIAGALAEFNAIVVLNETAHTSIGAASLSASGLQGARLQELADLPLLLLFCGFVKYDVEGIQGVWMRTYGAPRFGLPDLAALAAGHHEGELYFGMFETILAYVRSSGSDLAAGHTMQLGNDMYMKLRTATKDEYYLQSDDDLLVVEKVGAG